MCIVILMLGGLLLLAGPLALIFIVLCGACILAHLFITLSCVCCTQSLPSESFTFYCQVFLVYASMQL